MPADAPRFTTLANGDRVPLSAAASAYALLESHLEAPDQEWDLVYHLREVCLGRPVDPEPGRCLAANGLLDSDGIVPPVLKAVVLSAVRGRDRVLHLDSPFTSLEDHKIAVFLTAGDSLTPTRGADDQPPEHLRDPNAFLRRILGKNRSDRPTDSGPTHP